MKPYKHTTVAIIGAGPAGMAAALQLKRFGIEAEIFEQDKNGSLLKNAWSVENYLGFKSAVSGRKLLQKFRHNLAQNKITPINSKVEKLDYDFYARVFIISTATSKYLATYVFVASGTRAKELPLIVNSTEKIKENTFYEAFPLLKKRGKTIVIIGAGDAAFDGALNLCGNNNVFICNRSKKNLALPLLVNLALRHKNITYHKSCQLESVGPGVTKNLKLVFAKNGKSVYIEADYLLAAIGREAQKSFYSKNITTDELDLIEEGKLFLIGDVRNNIFRQVAIATGDGTCAAMQVFNIINKIKSND